MQRDYSTTLYMTSSQSVTVIIQLQYSLRSVDDLTAIGSAALVVLATAGSTNSVRTINAHLLTYGEQPSGDVILERRYGPRRLRDDDNDEYSLADSRVFHDVENITQSSLHPTQPNPPKIKKKTNDPTQPNPWMDPTHDQLWGSQGL